MSADDDPRLDEPLREYLAALEAGQPVDRGEFLGRHPDIAAVLRECLDGMEFIHAAARQLCHPGPDPNADGVPGALGECPMASLGDYRVVCEVGRGGMGVVYEAVQISLERKVALKVLPFAAAIDPKQRQRFQREARAAAQLHHTNIVPVYAVGSERGVHYYAMQFIDGQTLAGVIAELRLQIAEGKTGQAAPPSRRSNACKVQSATAPTVPVAALSTQRSAGDPAFYGTVARLGVQAALALEHAHHHGVVHRDIKPGNILVDERGNIWVSDFGLAHFQTEPGPTLSGDLAGTLRYMSPEQALTKHWLMDHRTDVYSLGATLYELLTLEPAFGGRDRQEILRQIAEVDPLPPRRRNRAIPVELETIVLKAMDKDPGRRYETAQALADDLGRYLADKPIRARRPTWRQVAVKWARRHRGIVWTATTAAVVGLLLGVAGLLASNLQIRQEKAQAEAARQRADRNAQLAIRALNQVYLRVAEDRYPRNPVLTPEDRDLLKLALGFYQEVARENHADPGVQQSVVSACLRVGDIQARLGEHGLARDAVERALTLGAQLAAERPADYDARAALAEAHQSLGRLLRQTGDVAGGLDRHLKALELCKRLVRDFPSVPNARKMLANSHTALGKLAGAAGEWRTAEYCFGQAAALHTRLTADDPTERGHREDLANSHGNLGNAMAQTGRRAEAETQLRKALELQSRLAAAHANVPRYRQEEAESACNLGNLLARSRKLRAAHTSYQRALELRGRLVAEFPSVPDYRHDLAVVHENLVLQLTRERRQADADQHFRRALGLRSRLIADFPAVPEYRQEMADLHYALANVLADHGDRETAATHYRRALDDLTRLGADFPVWPFSSDNRFRLALVHIDLGRVLWLTRDPAAARQHLDLGVLEPMLTAEPAPAYRLTLGNAHNTLGAVLESAGDWAAAERHFRQALQLWSRLADAYPAETYYREFQTLALANLGNLLYAQGEQAAGSEQLRRAIAVGTPLADEAMAEEAGEASAVLRFLAELLANCPEVRLRDPDRAVALARRAVAASPHSVACSSVLALAYYRAGNHRAALDALEREDQARRRRDPDECFLLAMLHGRLGDTERARHCYDEAARDTQAHWPGDVGLQRLRREAAALLESAKPSNGNGSSP
jgi:serine/threonine protein kinase